jgi:hypothetical protein
VFIDPCSPLGWTLVWEQAMVPGWRDAALRSLGDRGVPDIVERRQRADEARRFRTDLNYLTPAELVDRARGFLPLVRSTFAGAVAAGGRPDPADPQAELDDGGSDAMEPALWALSRIVAGSADLPLYFDGGIPGILERLDASPSSDAKVFLDAFDTFLYDHGCRGPGEWDVAGDVWETRPDLALARLEHLRSLPDDANPGRSLPDRADASRAMVGTLKVVNEIRIAIREVGRQIADASHIADAGLVMMLTADELDDFVAHPETYGLKLAARARNL